MKFYRTNGCVTAYRYQKGIGPTLVFIHALGCDQTIWDDVRRRLARGQSKLSYDLRGHGLSEVTPGPYSIDMLADDLLGLLDHLGLDDVILCGLSVGGLIAQAIAIRQPQNLRGVIYCNSAARIGTPDHWSQRIQHVEAQGLEPMADTLMDAWFSPGFRTSFPDIWTGARTRLTRTATEGYNGMCAALRDADMTPHLSDQIQRALCIAGAADDVVTAAETQDFAASLPDADCITLGRAGHFSCIEAPQDMADLIRTFVHRCRENGSNRYQRGMARRRAVLGDAHVDAAEAASLEYDRPFQTLITECAWGAVWSSDVIPPRERSMLTLALLAALGNFDEIPMHIRACLRTGASCNDIQEAFHHVALYAGLPRANQALKIAKKTFEEMGNKTF